VGMEVSTEVGIATAEEIRFEVRVGFSGKSWTLKEADLIIGAYFWAC
jgi:hypothetical protein